MAPQSAPSVAYFEEVDDEDHIVPGTSPKYARSTAHSSPSKEKPNTGRARKDSSRRESRSPITSLSDSDTTEPPLPLRRESTKLKMKEDRKRGPLGPKQRPAARSHKTAPAPSSRMSEDAQYYGIHPSQTVASASSSRPRARTRPESYYGQHAQHAQYAQRPPLSTSAFAHQHPPPSPFPPPSFPPAPQWMGPPPPIAPHALVHQPGASPPYGEFNPPPRDFNPPPRDLASRFRPRSAMGFHQSSKSHDYESSRYDAPSKYDPPPTKHELSKEKALARRTSAARKASKTHEDTQRMPPPPRPASTQPNRLVIRQPPPQLQHHTASRRKSVGFEDEDLDGEPTMYKTVARREVEYGSGALPSTRPRRRSSFDGESVFDMPGPYDIEPASRGRRNSFYNLEDKLRTASQYQDDVAGGTVPPLTADALRRVKNGGSSRSTRSSASRDESDYKQSATTRTTTSDGDDDITIKLPMGAVIEVGNTKIHCRDGGDINIGRNNNGASRAGGSDHTTNYSEDRKSRVERPVARARANSQAGSFSRTRQTAPPMYAPSHSYYEDDHYDTRYAPQGILPYEYSDDDDDDYSLA